jgi:hypothetical protein
VELVKFTSVSLIERSEPMGETENKTELNSEKHKMERNSEQQKWNGIPRNTKNRNEL